MSNEIQKSNINSGINFISLTEQNKRKEANLSAIASLQSAIQAAAQIINQNASTSASLSEPTAMMTTEEQISEDSSETSSSTFSFGGMDAVFEMEALLGLLQETYIEFAASNSENLVTMGSAIIDVLDDQYDKITKQLEKERKWDHMSFWDKLKCGFKLVFDTIEVASALTFSDIDAVKSSLKEIENNPVLGDVIKGLGYIAMAATVLVACATGNIELLALTLVFFSLTQSGALNSMTNEIAKGLEKAGLSESVAKVLSDVIVTLSFVIAGAGAGGIEMAIDDTSMTAADLAGEEGIEMVEMGVESVGETTANTTEEAGQKIGFNLKRAIGVGLNIGGQTLASTNIGMDLANVLPVSEKDKMKWMIALEVLVILSSIAATLGGGLMSASAEGESAISSQLKSLMSKMSGYVSEEFPQASQNLSMNADSVMHIGRMMGTVANGLSGFYSIMLGKATIDRGDIQKKMKEWEGNIAILSSTLAQNQNMVQTNQKQEQTTLTSFNNMAATYSDFAAPQLAVANEMLQG